jgi:hypothetical protein
MPTPEFIEVRQHETLNKIFVDITQISALYPLSDETGSTIVVDKAFYIDVSETVPIVLGLIRHAKCGINTSTLASKFADYSKYESFIGSLASLAALVRANPWLNIPLYVLLSWFLPAQ